MNFNDLIDTRIADPKYNFGFKGFKDGKLIEGLDYSPMTVTGSYGQCQYPVPSAGGRLAK